MFKLIIGLALILLSGCAWLYIGHLSKQEIVASRARAASDERAKAEMRNRFESVIATDLAYCFVEAEQANSDYISRLHKPVRLTPGKITVTKTDFDKAAKMLKTAKEECQLTYEFRLKYVE